MTWWIIQPYRLDAQSERLHQFQSMTDENAYAPVVADSKVAPRKRRWMYRFLILNALLFGLPVGLAIAALVMLALNGVQITGTSGSLGLGTMLFAVACIAFPNLIMAVVCLNEKRRGVVTQQE